MTHYPDSVRQWLATPFGEALLQRESRVVEESLDGIFGEQCLQLGLWGESNLFLRHARTQRKWLLDVGAPHGRDNPSIIGKFHRLPVQDSSIDCVVLPHVLDYSDRPHAILREVDRVLTAHGHVVILGFKTGGLWGVRRLIPGAGLPPEAQHLVPERRLKDWLQLLDMRIQANVRYFFRWPIPLIRGASSPRWETRGQRWWPELAACYMLTAQKRVSPLTPVKPVWRRNPKVVAGLAETTNRVSRIKFDPKS
ncbi:MAG: methyltransferase domain-containing protein [Woeseiaceae bacterium]|nr:methyltransferase domain-containing protein [Woeseiaceae bacterium]